MATSAARSHRQPRDGAHLSANGSLLSRGGGTDVRAPARRPAPDADMVRSSSREPAWLVDLTAQITRSVNAIEHIVERVGTMRDDNSYLRAVTANLREALEAERLDSGRKLVAQNTSITQQKRRAVEAERSADTLAGMLNDLERQINGRRERDAGPGAGRPTAPRESGLRGVERFRRAG